MAGFGDLKVAEAKLIHKFNHHIFAKFLREKALPPYGDRKCARYVRRALEAAGVNTGGHPENAKNYGEFLIKRGFAIVEMDNYKEAVGDIIIFQAPSTSPPGHIQGFDGRNWISDFIQPKMFPGPSYLHEKTSYAVYRY